MIEANDVIAIDRGQAQKDAQRESKEEDLKQHADKLILGFEIINANSANRAIWELTKYAGDNKYNVQNIEEIEHCIKFNSDIGFEVAYLIEILTQTNEPESIYLDGNDRTLVPMKFIERGDGLHEFEKYLIQFLTK